MKSKTLIGGLIAGVLSFFLGWLVFGLLMHNYYEANTIKYEGLERAEPIMWALIIANLAWGLLLAYVMDAAGANSIVKGFTCGFIVFLLIALGTDMFFIAFMRLMRLRLAAIDIGANALFGGVIGAVVGWWYSRGNKAAA